MPRLPSTRTRRMRSSPAGGTTDVSDAGRWSAGSAMISWRLHVAAHARAAALGPFGGSRKDYSHSIEAEKAPHAHGRVEKLSPDHNASVLAVGEACTVSHH